MQTCTYKKLTLRLAAPLLIAALSLSCTMGGRGSVFSGAEPSAVAPIERRGETGIASYYAESFAGKMTASGEHFDPEEFTAAHRSLPFNTRVQVRNLENGKTVTVRINDRGPFVRSRIIDLSPAAARSLSFFNRGLARVEIEELPGSQRRQIRQSQSAANVN